MIRANPCLSVSFFSDGDELSLMSSPKKINLVISTTNAMRNLCHLNRLPEIPRSARNDGWSFSFWDFPK